MRHADLVWIAALWMGALKLGAGSLPCVVLSGELAAKWKAQGLCVAEAEPADAIKASAPGVRWATRGGGTASATTAPFLTANGWRFLMEPAKTVVYEAPRDAAVLPAAEAFAYDMKAVLKVDPADVERLGAFLTFLRSIPADGALKPAANIAVVNNGSALLPEALNLMSRRNLLYRVVKAADSSVDLNVTIGSAEFPEATAADPYAFADAVRTKLTDRKRLLRIFGTESVLGRLETGPGKARVHLLNYTTSRVEGVRVRVAGSYEVSRLAVFGVDGSGVEGAAVTETVSGNNTLEFTVPVMGPYAVIDLKSAK